MYVCVRVCRWQVREDGHGEQRFGLQIRDSMICKRTREVNKRERERERERGRASERARASERECVKIEDRITCKRTREVNEKSQGADAPQTHKKKCKKKERTDTTNSRQRVGVWICWETRLARRPCHKRPQRTPTPSPKQGFIHQYSRTHTHQTRTHARSHTLVQTDTHTHT